MSSSPPSTSASPKPAEPAWKEFARSPLVPVAMAVTLGLIADRYGPVPLHVSLFAAVGALVGWFVARRRSQPAAVGWLWVAAAALAAAHHHNQRYEFDADDLG